MKRISLLLSLLLCISLSAKKEKQTIVELLTSKGKITLRLYNETPLHRDNFVKLVKEGYFNDLLFHRVIQDFMIQGGDPDSRDAAPGRMLGEGGPDYTLPAEIRFPQIFHKRGVLAAAREGDLTNPERRSSGSQFYIVWGKTFSREDIDKLAARMERDSGGKFTMPDEVRKYYMHYGGTPHLDGAYTVFGEVVKGIEVVNAIQQVATDTNDRPIEDIKILYAEIKK
ncbi:MAG: peptidylprolyl isomerase [Bacteroidaceae bacterium]|nr:peptidylprolyl isomerase [Bacteroidaceae bacterium]MBR4782995.1 peptidylprolyl isomerase [Bacteroidaceae bacterium]